MEKLIRMTSWLPSPGYRSKPPGQIDLQKASLGKLSGKLTCQTRRPLVSPVLPRREDVALLTS